VSARKPIYPSNVSHSDSYYRACILIFISGLQANQTHAQIAQHLNATDLTTVRGLPWDAETLKQVLKRIRLNRDYRSSFHQALLRLVYAVNLSVAQTLPLFTIRVTGVQ
jgi:hypothetical protein